MMIADLFECFFTAITIMWIYQSARNWEYENVGNGFLNNFMPTGDGNKVYKTPVLQSMLLVLGIFNLIPICIKLVGYMIRAVGCCRQKTRKPMYIARMASGAVLILLVISQAIFSLTMIGNASSIRDSFMTKAFGAMGTIDAEVGTRLSEADLDNYQRMDLGLCMFCSPESCEERFSKYEIENALLASATTTETEGSSGTGTKTEESTASETN